MTDTTLHAIDGRDALFYLIVRPGEDRNEAGTGGRGVTFEHGGSGLTKAQAAYILRQVADRLLAEDRADQCRCGAVPVHQHGCPSN